MQVRKQAQHIKAVKEFSRRDQKIDKLLKQKKKSELRSGQRSGKEQDQRRNTI